jgi:hypothetical protein
MILSGMGPVKNLNSDAAKVFASCYALFSGVVFISATGIRLAPMFHRVLHRFHLEQKDLRRPYSPHLMLRWTRRPPTAGFDITLLIGSVRQI